MFDVIGFDVMWLDMVGQVGPAQACGLICVGDVLVGVGDDRVKGLSFPSILGENMLCIIRGRGD